MIKRWYEWGLVLLLVAMLAGCRTQSITDPVIGPSYKPRNVFRQTGPWLLELRRVAVLPLAYNPEQPNAVAGRDAMEPILRVALTKAQRFECVPVTPDLLKKWTRREMWSASEPLPKELLEMVKTELGCDAVIFPELTQYRPYSPMVIGWNLKLVSLKTQQILWAVDETFDAGDLSVANGARRFQMRREASNPALADSRQILTSPRIFGQFTAEEILDTLPEH